MPQALVVDHVHLGVDILSRNTQEPKLRNSGRGVYHGSNRGAPRNISVGYEEEYNSDNIGGVGKMYSAASPRDNARTYGSPVSNSPMSRKQAILQRQSLDKYTNVSDGESDSGSSTLTEARHELAPEIEYSWECPSGLSLLLELMTQSPQRNSGRDVTEAGYGARSPQKCSNEFAPADGFAEKYVLYQKKPEVNESLQDKRVARGDRLCNRFEEITERNLDYTDGTDRQVHQINPIRSYADSRESTAGTEARYDEPHEQQEQKYYYAQRKISFDSGKYGSCNSEHQRAESPVDEPIDYSQLSSRRREIVDHDVHTKHEPQDLSSRLHEEECSVEYRKRESEISRDVGVRPPALVPKYEFILSPKMDNNGNLILHQPQRSTCAKSISQDQLKRKANDAIQILTNSKYASCDYKQDDDGIAAAQNSLSNTPPSYEVAKYDMRGSPVSTVQVVSSEPSKYSVEKMDIPYHPKLKYLMAASQYAKSKAKLEEFGNEVKQKTPSILFSQDIATESEMPIQSPEADERDYASPLSVPTTVHSTNVFILNTGSSLFTSEAPTGSQLNQQTNQIIEIHPHHLTSSSTIHISGPVIGSSDLMVQDPYQSNPVSPSPGDQPLSPASLQEQQSTLSDLLFSANRKPGVDPYACADCGKRYSTSSNLARHRQTHRSVCDKKARKCPHCEKVYVSMPAYSMHVRTHNQGCECPHCGKKFSRPWLLQGHIRTHTGEKPFGCPQCGKSFADKSNLRAHIQTHSTDKPYVCGRCGKAFALKSYLYKHEESSCMRGQRFRN